MLILKTHQQLLRNRFAQTRRVLGGESDAPAISAKSDAPLFEEITLFEATAQQPEPVVSSDAAPKVAAATKPDQVPTAPAAPVLAISEQPATFVPHKNWYKRVLSFVLSLVSVASIAIALIIFVPAVYYLVFPADVIEITPPEQGTAYGGNFEDKVIEVPEEELYVPPVDETLPEGDWLVIPRIGVRTELRETENPEEALAKGVWHVPDFGEPGDREEPMILAAHRYGWQWWWQDEYWKYNSFYLLPDTEPGDRIEIISDQRKWVYEIYAGEEGDEITDYNADLILYTCKFLQGPVRHFRYARLIDPTQSTQ